MSQAPTATPDAPDSEKTVSGFFRCPVSSDNNRATIRIGRKKMFVEVHETSIDGFTVLVSPKQASRLKVGRPWMLQYDGTQIEVHPQWMFNAPDGHVQLGLRRLRDLTRPERAKRSLISQVGGRRFEDPSISAVTYGGFVMFLFLLLALPGLGDRLGTSDRIENAFRWILTEVNHTIDGYL